MWRIKEKKKKKQTNKETIETRSKQQHKGRPADVQTPSARHPQLLTHSHSKTLTLNLSVYLLFFSAHSAPTSALFSLHCLAPLFSHSLTLTHIRSLSLAPFTPRPRPLSSQLSVGGSQLRTLHTRRACLRSTLAAHVSSTFACRCTPLSSPSPPPSLVFSLSILFSAAFNSKIDDERERVVDKELKALCLSEEGFETVKKKAIVERLRGCARSVPSHVFVCEQLCSGGSEFRFALQACSEHFSHSRRHSSLAATRQFSSCESCLEMQRQRRIRARDGDTPRRVRIPRSLCSI